MFRKIRITIPRIFTPGPILDGKDPVAVIKSGKVYSGKKIAELMEKIKN